MAYSRNFGSNFPNSLIPLGTHKDVDSSVVNLINQYNSYVQSGNMTGASNLYESNRSTLEPYILNTSYLNRLEEEIYNTGMYAINQTSDGSAPIVSPTQPTGQTTGAFWFKDY